MSIIKEEEAALLIKSAAEKAAVLLTDAAEKAALLPIDAAEKAALLSINAAEKAALLLKAATEKVELLSAEKKAALLLKEATEKVFLLPKDSVEKMTSLLNEATRDAILILKEEAENLATKKIIFLDLAAHELRTPITSISLLLQVVERQIEKKQAVPVEILARLRTPVDRLAKLIGDLMDMSKLDKGLLTLEFVKTDIVTLISQCLEEFQILAPTRNFFFNKPDQPIEINIDPLRINQVLSNLLDNAIKFSCNGPIEVALEVMPAAIRVSVTDHGSGIPKEKQQTLFTIFSKGTSEEATHTIGLGLGLSVSKRIIDLHSGTIGVESEENKGSTFYFELPKMKAEADNDKS